MTKTTALQCPICQKPVQPAHTPFCSARCREVDLNKWFTGSYAVPAVELDDADIDALLEGDGEGKNEPLP